MDKADVERLQESNGQITAEKIICPECKKETQFLIASYLGFDFKQVQNIYSILFLLFWLFPIVMIFVAIITAMSEGTIISYFVSDSVISHIVIYISDNLHVILVSLIFISILTLGIVYLLVNTLRIPFGTSNLYQTRFSSILNIKRFIESEKYVFNKNLKVGTGTLFIHIDKNGEHKYGRWNEFIDSGAYKHVHYPIHIHSFCQCPSCLKVYNLQSLLSQISFEDKLKPFEVYENGSLYVR